MEIDKKHPILLFDGVCHLCHGAVRFILKREKKQELKFAPLQSPTGKKLLKEHGYAANYLEGMILIEGKHAYSRSTACLRVAHKLKFPWNLFASLLVIPKPARDLIYQLVASQRYRLLGKKDACCLPEGHEMSRFL